MREGPDIVTLEFSELAGFDVGSFASINFMTLAFLAKFLLVQDGGIIPHYLREQL